MELRTSEDSNLVDSELHLIRSRPVIFTLIVVKERWNLRSVSGVSDSNIWRAGGNLRPEFEPLPVFSPLSPLLMVR